MNATSRGDPGLILDGWRAALVWLAVASSILLVLLTTLLLSGTTQEFGLVVLGLVMVPSFAGVGGFVATRRPSNAIGWLMLTAAVLIAVTVFGINYVMHSVAETGGNLPGTAGVGWLIGLTFTPAVILVGVFVPLLFPDGRLPSDRLRWRVFVVAATIGLGLSLVPRLFGVGPLDNTTISNPFGFIDIAKNQGFWDAVGGLSAAFAFSVALAAPVIRFRRANNVERQQLKWLGSIAIATGSTLLVLVVNDVGWILFLIGLALIPVAIGIAILRYRLYEIDRLVSRTIAYAVVTGGLIAVYLAINLTLTTVFSALARENPAVVAASTLAVAALFAPLRRRVQRVVDRRFDRARYDAERTSAAFSDRLRNEVDLAAVAADFRDTVRTAIAPSSVGVWLRVGER